MSVTYTPNMQLVVPGVGTEPGPLYATDINQSLNTIDSHDHSIGKGSPVPASALNWDANISINNKAISNINYLSLTSLGSTLAGSVTSALYSYNGDLYYNNGSGNGIKMTAGTALNVTSTGISSGTANASFISNVLTVTAAPTVPANIDGASIVLRNNTANSKGITLSPPVALASDYILVLPSLPAQTNVMTLDSSGNMGSVTYNTVGTSMTSPGADGIAAVMSTTGTSSIVSTMTAANANTILSKMSYTPSFRNRVINGSMSIDQRNNGAAQTITAGGVAGIINNCSITSGTNTLNINNASNGFHPNDLIQPPTGANTYVPAFTASSGSGSIGAYTLYQTHATNIAGINLNTKTEIQYTVDRWFSYCTGANVTGQRVAGTGNTLYRYQFTGAASVTGISFGQRIESSNAAYLAGQTATLSFDMANSLLTSVTITASYATSTADQFGNVTFPSKTTIGTPTVVNINSTITRYSVQITMPSAASNGVEILFSVGAQTSGTWTIGNVQLEAGSVATAFESKPINEILSQCQRYFYRMGGLTVYQPYGVGMQSGTAGVYQIFSPSVFRSYPSFKYLGTVNGLNTGSYVMDDGVALAYPTRIDLGINFSTTTNIGSIYSYSTLTAGRGTRMYSNNTTTSSFYFSAEL